MRTDARPGIRGWLAAGWLILVVLAAIFGPYLPLQEPSAQGPCTTRQPIQETGADGEPIVTDGRIRLIEQPGCSFQQAADDRPGALPSTEHLLGNDQIGRDLLSRLVSGARTTILVAFGATALALLIGGSIGIVAASIGGPLDQGVTALSTGALAIPGLVLAISLVAALGQNSLAVTLALTVTAMPIIVIVTRIRTAAVIAQDYVTAATMIGATRRRILFREVVPGVAPSCLAFLGIGIAVAVGTEGGLAVLGLSVAEPATSWGTIIEDGRPLIESTPHISLLAAGTIFLTILSVTIISDHVGERLGIRSLGL